MRQRTFMKIVNRVTSGRVTASSYSRQDVERAFRSANRTLTPEMLAPWTEAEAARVAGRVESKVNEGRAKARKATARAHNQERRDAKSAARQEQQDKRERAITAARILQARVDAEDAEDAANAAGVLSAADYTSMSVADLKAACKSRNIKGYSKLNKEAIINLLVSNKP